MLLRKAFIRTGKSRNFRSTISWNDEAVEIIFNFVVTILETALKCSPTVAPTKAGEHSDKKINNFDGEIWSMVYSSYLADGEEEIEATPQVDLDD